jgi:Lhr-like helicase
MKNTAEVGKYELPMNQLIKNIIKSEIGATEKLPLEAMNRIKEVYSRFIPAYVEIMRVKGGHPPSWRPETLTIDAEIVEDMMHFFSDYQHIAREFKAINHKVIALLGMDRRKNPKKYNEWLNHIISGTSKKKILSSIVEESFVEDGISFRSIASNSSKE